MIRLTLRQFRLQAWVAVGLLLIVAALLGSTGPHLATLYDDYLKAQTACGTSPRCLQVNVSVDQFDRLLELIGTGLVGVPGLLGAFWGAPLISRELENGTHRLAWTQSVSRIRWLAVKLGLVGAASVLATGLLSLMVTWWSAAMDRAQQNRFDAGLFGERNIVPIGYAAFGFVLGVAVGLLIRRTLPAMATTLAVFLAARLGFTYLIRQHLLPPVHSNQPLATVVDGFGQNNGGPPTLFASSHLPNAWVYSTRIVDGHGHVLSPQDVAAQCPDLTRPFTEPAAAGATSPVPFDPKAAFQSCVTKLSSTYHGAVNYQPANRYWSFQVVETSVFLAAALGLAVLCFYRIRRGAY